MPSYTQYMRQMAVLDSNDDDIESWITVRGNHIPIMKGQSKEDAVKSFLEKKDGGEKTVQSVSGQKWTGVKLEGKYHQFYKKEDAENFIKEAKAHGSKESDIELVGFGVKEGNAAKPESKKGGSDLHKEYEKAKNELKKKREKLAGSSGTKAPKVTKVDAKKWNSPASDPWKSLYD